MKTSELKDTAYNSYYKPYVLALGEVELNEELENGMNNFIHLLNKIPESRYSYAYEEGKWTIAEVILHIIDTERVFQYRALCFSRNDKTKLPGFEQNDYALESNAKNRSKASLINEYTAVRKSTIALYNSFNEGTLQRTGNANDSITSVGAQGFILAGHQAHHKKIIEERYV